ncbi:unnamed protein product [[Actinomadura] parvosata subsp. kistnae]|uniref:Lipoprotein n=2 Tax=Nonomuraea TaxID=83681 RepID=A0A1V0A3K7_9ACTN|nr:MULTISPECIES: hypothetical protein [unclassified Nonomuraea]AQZ64739.1 hypothetical protein BKM31_27705 [Nonomuraea sp. ATCC 55076]NJP97299.1 hypothetical protein [Nonomuraea sp. FMUSA5-5]SPL98513.1 unnamed protein product [Actinomadura parvosata subsp. kistnae]
MKRSATIALILPVLLVLFVGCQEGASSAQKYSTGGDPTDRPCDRVVSAIGYADLILEPRGQEDRQNFEDAVIGRLAEANGITREFGPRLPDALRPAAETVKQTTAALSKSDVPRQRQVALLRQYRAAADRIVAGCR